MIPTALWHRPCYKGTSSLFLKFSLDMSTVKDENTAKSMQQI